MQATVDPPAKTRPIGPPGLVRWIPLAPHQLSDPITPTDKVFTLVHLGVPQEIDASRWTLEVGGLVRHPRRFTLDELRTLPKRSVESVHQCAGNPFRPTLATRRVCNVVWSGVALTDILERVGVKREAGFVWSFGADSGMFEDIEVEAYAKDMPLQRLDAGDVLVAYELNGKPLPVRNGFPLRLFIPGYYGTNCVKWLRRIELAAHRFEGVFTTRLYNDAAPPQQYNPAAPTKPVWQLAPEAVIVSPAPGDIVTGPVEVIGWAWSYDGIESVEVSDDGGQSWRSAEVSPRRQWAWQRFSCRWTPDWTGETQLSCRARSRRGDVQPASGARNEIQTIAVNVQSAATRAAIVGAKEDI